MMSMIGLKFMRRTSKCNGFNSKKTLLTTTSTATVGHSQFMPFIEGGLERDITGQNMKMKWFQFNKNNTYNYQQLPECEEFLYYETSLGGGLEWVKNGVAMSKSMVSI